MAKDRRATFQTRCRLSAGLLLVDLSFLIGLGDVVAATHNVRVITIKDQPWFVANDVLFAMGFSRVDNMLRVLDASEKSLTPHPVRGVDDKSRIHSLISESGLYKLIMRSDKPSAKKFQNWVTQEVLPRLRKDGDQSLSRLSNLAALVGCHLPPLAVGMP